MQPLLKSTDTSLLRTTVFLHHCHWKMAMGKSGGPGKHKFCPVIKCPMQTVFHQKHCIIQPPTASNAATAFVTGPLWWAAVKVRYSLPGLTPPTTRELTHFKPHSESLNVVSTGVYIHNWFDTGLCSEWPG